MIVKTITPQDRLGQLPFTPSVTSSDLGWSAIRLEDYRNLPPSDLKMPPMNHHIVALHYKPPAGILKHGCGESISENVMALNDITYVPAGADNSWEFGESQPHCLHILVEASFFNQIALTTFDIDPGRLDTRRVFQTQDKQLQTMAQLLHMELHQQGGNGPLYVESLGTALTVRLLHTFSNFEKQPRFISATLDPTSLRQVQDLILANLEHGVSLQEMADLVHLSRYHFSRLFKASLGVTPSQYLLQARLEKAKRLLLQTTAKISVVAARTGFADQAYLTRRFKARFGLTPARFRARYRQ